MENQSSINSIFFNGLMNFKNKTLNICSQLVLIIIMTFLALPSNLKACHNESDTWTSIVNNGNGTYTITFQMCVESGCEKSSGVRITVGGANIVSAITASLVGNAGTVFPGAPAGGVIDYGTPFNNATVWMNNPGGCTQTCYSVSLIVNAVPTSISHSGTEYTLGYCSTAPLPPPCTPALTCRDVTINLGTPPVTIQPVVPPTSMLPAQLKGVGGPCPTAAVAVTTCNCPPGSVAVGYTGSYPNLYGVVLAQFKLNCRAVNPDGSFGAATSVTCNNGAVVGTTTSTVIANAGEALVGFENRMGCGIDNLKGFSKPIAAIIAGGSNATNNVMTGIGGGGGGLQPQQLVPDGNVVVGMQTYEDPSTGGLTAGYAWKYAKLSDVMKGITTVTNDCGGITTVSLSKSSFDCSNAGITSVTATANAGNTSTCSFNVTVLDIQPPTILCPSNISATASVGVCNALVCYPNPTSTDNCGPVTPAGYTFKTSFGNSYYYRANATSNFATANANAKAAGGHLAVITSAAEQAAIQASAPGACWMGGGDIVVEGTFKWFDCEPLSYTNWCSGEPNGGTNENYLEFEAPGCWNDLNLNQLRFGLLEIEGTKITQTTGLAPNASFPVGVTTNTFMATDAAGNTATCSFTVGVSAASCKTPVQIYHTDTTSNSGKVKWLNASGNCTTGYELRIRVEITPGVWGAWSAWAPANGTLQHLFSGLSSGSFYNYQIHTNCGPAKNSVDVNDWFHTLGGGGALVDGGQHIRTLNSQDQIINAGNFNNDENLFALQEELPMNLTFAPNPANDFTAVTIQGFEQHEKTITMIGLNGKLVFNIKVDSNQNQLELELSRLNAQNGVYLIRVSDGKKQKTGQLVIQRN